MPSDRTTVTELGTALGMLGATDVDVALRSRTPVMHSLSPEMWDRLTQLRAGGAFDTEFHAAFENGRAFLAAEDGLRGRRPNVVEWKGTGRAPGDEVAPIDLRVDHVYLVSCKYLSAILFNASPSHVFDDLLVGGRGSRSGREKRLAGDWYAEVAPAQYEELYAGVRRAALDRDGTTTVTSTPAAEPRPRSAATTPTGAVVSLPGLDGDGARTDQGDLRRDTAGPPALLRALPTEAALLSSEQREALGSWLRPGWPGYTKALYAAPVRSCGRGVGPAVGTRHGRAGRQRRGDPVAAPAHGRRAVLRPGLVAQPLAAPAHRHRMGLAPAVPADLHHDGAAGGRATPGDVVSPRAGQDDP